VLDPERPEPEVLSLTHLSFGNGLPAALQDVEDIERAREKRAFEASLPEIKTEADFERRRELLQQQEMKDWELREQQIIAMEKARLNLLMKAIREREAMKETRMQERLELLRQAKEKEYETILVNSQKKRIKGRFHFCKSPSTESVAYNLVQL
jgi:hypothetical protein